MEPIAKTKKEIKILLPFIYFAKKQGTIIIEGRSTLQALCCRVGSQVKMCSIIGWYYTSLYYFLNCHQTLGKADKLEKKLADLEDRIQDLEEKTEERQQENVNLFKEIHKSLGQLC